MPGKSIRNRNAKGSGRELARRPKNDLYVRNIPRLFGDGMPNRLRATLPYSEQVSFNPGVGTTASYYWRANDCYDPNYTGTGHQPKGFDNFMPFYNHFIVEKARFKATVMTPNTTSVGIGRAVAGVFSGVTDLSSIVSGAPSTIEAAFRESWRTNKLDFTWYGFAAMLQQGMLSPARDGPHVKCVFDFREWFGKDPDPALASFQGDASSSPVEQAFFGVAVYGWNSGEDVGAVDVCVEIEYDVIFMEPRTVPTS